MEINIFSEPYTVRSTFWRYLASDLHIDHAGFDHPRMKRDFDEAQEAGARCYIAGDVFDAILPADKKRYTAAGQKERRDDVVNAMVDRAFEVLVPYADFIDLISIGNHETALIKHNGVDPVSLLLRDLNRVRKPETVEKYGRIRHGGYQGFLRLRFSREDGANVKTYTIFYNHGQGGSAEVTKGGIDLARRSYISADLVWMGHKHTKIAELMDPEVGLDQANRLYVREKRGIITGCYIKPYGEYNIDTDGYRLSFGAERMRVPQAQGGAMLRLDVSRDSIEGRLLV